MDKGIIVQGYVIDIDYSHGIIYFKPNAFSETWTCTWSGCLKANINDIILVYGEDFDAFSEASSYHPNSAKLIKLFT